MRARSTLLLALVACGGTDTNESASPPPRAAPPPASPAPTASTEPGPKEAQVGLGDPNGGLHSDEILTTVKGRKVAINACYETELQKRPTLAGKLVVSWEIGAEGRTEKVALKSTTLNDATVESCVLAEVAKLVFPLPRDGKRVKVNFPFLFQPRGDR
jgi:hypothetical protein